MEISLYRDLIERPRIRSILCGDAVEIIAPWLEAPQQRQGSCRGGLRLIR
jgi:hypothetical protein